MGAAAKPLRFNLGCGSTVDPAWVNLDASPNLLLRRVPWVRNLLWRVGIISEAAAKAVWDPCVRRHDLRKGIPCADGAADAVYASHFFEHLPRPTAGFLAREAFRETRIAGGVELVERCDPESLFVEGAKP